MTVTDHVDYYDVGEKAFYEARRRGGPDYTTRKKASSHSYWAVHYGRYVDKKPHKITRNGACKDPENALDYAKNVDKKPGKQTRNAACRDPYYAVCYARSIDKKASKQTRKAACYVLDTAIIYAEEIDTYLHPCVYDFITMAEESEIDIALTTENFLED